MPGAGSVRLSRLKAGIHKRLLTLHRPPPSPVIEQASRAWDWRLFRRRRRLHGGRCCITLA